MSPPRHWRFRPRSIAGQIALLVIAAILVAQFIAGFALVALREPWRPDARPMVAVNRVAAIARILDASEPDERPTLLPVMARSLPSLHLARWDGAAPPSDQDTLAEHPIIERLHEAYGKGLEVADLAPDPNEDEPSVLKIGLTTPHGVQLSATIPGNPIGPPKRNVIVPTVFGVVLSLALLTLWAARALTKPLAQLAAAAEAFGTRSEPAPLPRRGPKEVLALAAALDRMRERVKKLLDDRTQMLAAISHDLRTPITRLRLRAEFIEDEEARERTLRDLDLMNALVEGALAYARDERDPEAASDKERPLIDLASLTQTVCDGFTDTGADVRMEATRHVLVRADPDDLERALTNLVDNAVKYAGRAWLSVSRSMEWVAITVEDDGPGIPEAERQAMLQPFVRGDRARNLDTASGFGLGLSIVTRIVAGHGGRLGLENRPGGGLRARIELPLADRTARSGGVEQLAAE